MVRLCRREWLDMVGRLNKAAIGAPLDLAEFLFGSDRNPWPGIRPLLRELQEGRCFYCQQVMRTGQEDLDHFIPWSLYPNDLAHNFVLACRRCNGVKGDDLAKPEALERWIDRNKTHGHRIGVEAALIGLRANENASARVAAWAYEREKNGSKGCPRCPDTADVRNPTQYTAPSPQLRHPPLTWRLHCA